MLRGLFVTGTDTSVGKTIVSAALMHCFRGHGPLRYWKPIETGIEVDDDTAMVRNLGACALHEVLGAGIRLPGLVAPYLAAERKGTRVAVADVARFMVGETEGIRWIVEGAGGPLVPINESEFMTDLMRHLGLPALVVTRSTLGTINHTLAILETLRNRGIPVFGCVMVGPPNRDNRNAIERWSGVDLIVEMPIFPDLTAAALASWAESHTRLFNSHSSSRAAGFHVDDSPGFVGATGEGA